MDITKLKFTKLQNEIFRILCIKAGLKLNQREISNILNVSPTAIAKALPLLKKEEIIKIEKEHKVNLNLISFNRDFEKAIFLKRVENLKMVYESGIVQFLYNHLPGSTIILFGSYSKGEDVFNSDIDLAVIGYKEKNLNLEEFNKKLGRIININYYSSWNINKNLKNNLLNGITLVGGIEI